MIGISLQGVPLAGIPLAGIPLAGIDLSSSPLAGIPLAGIDLEGSPLAGIPLAGIDFASSPLAGIPLAGISTTAKDEILDCTGPFTCPDTATLGQAAAANAVKPDATVGDIGYYCKVGSPADAACNAGHTPILLKDFVLNGLPPDVTLEDLLASILSETAYDWEALPLPEFPIQDFSDDGGDDLVQRRLHASRAPARASSRQRSRSRSRTSRATSPARASCRPWSETRAGPDAHAGRQAALEPQRHPDELGSRR